MKNLLKKRTTFRFVYYLLGHNFGFLFLSRRVCDISSVDDATQSKKRESDKMKTKY